MSIKDLVEKYDNLFFVFFYLSYDRLRYILSNQTIAYLFRLFRAWDTDRTNYLSEDEFVKGVLDALPDIATEEELKTVFATFDGDQSSGIRAYEFIMKLFVSCS